MFRNGHAASSYNRQEISLEEFLNSIWVAVLLLVRKIILNSEPTLMRNPIPLKGFKEKLEIYIFEFRNPSKKGQDDRHHPAYFPVIMCCNCFDDSPEDDNGKKSWNVSMMDTPCKETGTFCKALVCCPCMAYVTRAEALGNDMSKYRCCAGYICCFEPNYLHDGETSGCLGEENCPKCCLGLEVCLCLGPAVSSTRNLVQEQFNLNTDPCDVRIMRFNNCMQCLSCFCLILSQAEPGNRDAASIVDLIAHIVFCTTQACMTAQTYHQLKHGNEVRQALSGQREVSVDGAMKAEKMARITVKPRVELVPEGWKEEMSANLDRLNAMNAKLEEDMQRRHGGGGVRSSPAA